MVRIAQSTVGQSSAYGNHRHGQPVIGDVVADVLGAAKGREVGNGISKNMVPLGGHAGRQTCHVLLGHASIDEAVWKAVGEWLDDRIAQITDHQGHLLVHAG